MPTLLRILGYVFSFYSNESNEPPHVHVEKGGAHGKIWIEPDIEVEYMKGFNPSEKKKVIKLVDENVETFKTKWYEFFKK